MSEMKNFTDVYFEKVEELLGNNELSKHNMEKIKILCAQTIERIDLIKDLETPEGCMIRGIESALETVERKVQKLKKLSEGDFSRSGNLSLKSRLIAQYDICYELAQNLKTKLNRMKKEVENES